MFCDAAYTATREYTEFWAKLGRGESQDGEFMRLAKDGTQIWIQARYSAMVDANGNTYKVVKYASDITAAIGMRRDAAEKSAIVENSVSIWLSRTKRLRRTAGSSAFTKTLSKNISTSGRREEMLRSAQLMKAGMDSARAFGNQLGK